MIHIKEILIKLLSYITDNILLFVSYLFSFLTPVGPLMFWLGVMVIFDLITGAVKDKKVNNVEIKSRKMRPTALKGLGYMIALIVALICQTLIAPDQPIIKGVFTLLFTIEAKSIDENIKETTGFSFLKPLQKYIDKLLNKNNE